MKSMGNNVGLPLRPVNPIDPQILNHELEQEIQDVLKISRTHMAGISIRRGTEDNITTMVTASGSRHQEHTITAEGGQIFHIASITKVLIAAAVVIAIEHKAMEDMPDKSYSRFAGIQDATLSRLYNEHSSKKMRPLPGDPIIYDFLAHNKGLPCANHRLIAPDGKPILTPAELRDEVLRQILHDRDTADPSADPLGSGYSNINYSIIAMTIEAMSEKNIATFMEDTLFRPLGMKSTSIGFLRDTVMENYGWVVNSNGEPLRILRPDYGPDGAEAGAFGAFSTVHDLDIFFKFLIDTIHGEKLPLDIGVDNAVKLFKLSHKRTGSLVYTPAGLDTNLHSPNIGSMSTNRLQFPNEQFSTYPVLSKRFKKKISTYYMAGTAIGCCCATAVYPFADPFVVVVLTDTSGPVDAADHILRLILRNIVRLRYPNQPPKRFPKPGSVKAFVESAMTASCRKWREIERDDMTRVAHEPNVNRELEGVYKGDGFSQRLVIGKKADGKYHITIRGTSVSSPATSFDLVWLDYNQVKIRVPPHLSVDSLGNGDWSNLVLQVPGQERVVVKLIRKTVLGEDHFSKQTI